MKDCIVLIPGIMGSVLTKRGKAIWSPSPAAPLTGLWTHFNALRLSDDTLEDRDVDGVEAADLVRWPHMIPDFWKIDAYSEIKAEIAYRFQIKPLRNYFEFAYDWRRDNRASARRLQRLSREWLRSWKASSGNHDARLILICHSMGGLIARYFLEVLEGWRDSRMLITFGTPFRGAAKALTTLANGIEYSFVPFHDNLSDVIRSFTSVYQLLPYYKCCELQPGAARQRVDAVIGISSLDRLKIESALHFHDEIRSAVEANGRLPDYSARAKDELTHHAYKFVAIVGIEQDTEVFANCRSGKIHPISFGGYDGGDGTVPRGPLFLGKWTLTEASLISARSIPC